MKPKEYKERFTPWLHTAKHTAEFAEALAQDFQRILDGLCPPEAIGLMGLSRFDSFLGECQAKLKRIGELIPEVDSGNLWTRIFHPELRKKRGYYCREELNKKRDERNRYAQWDEELRKAASSHFSRIFEETFLRAVLGNMTIPRTAHETYFNLYSGYTKEDVKRAFRKKSLETHPDSGGSSEAFRETIQMRDRALQFALE